jgi:hypothetical protein
MPVDVERILRRNATLEERVVALEEVDRALVVGGEGPRRVASVGLILSPL